MDPLLLGIVAVLAIIFLSLFKRRITRGAVNAAEKKINARGAAKVPAVLAEYGKSVILHAPPAAAAQVVNDAVAKVRRYKAYDGGWNIKVINPDDAQIELHAVSGGTQLRAVRMRSFNGLPLALKDWAKIRDLVVAQAATASVATSVPDTTVQYASTNRPEPGATDGWDWVAQA